MTMSESKKEEYISLMMFDGKRAEVAPWKENPCQEEGIQENPDRRDRSAPRVCRDWR